MSDLILRSWNNKNIRHRADGFMSLTDMCQAAGKNFGHWNELKSTKEYLAVLSGKYYRDHDSTPIEVNEGGGTKASGTWGDRRVAIRLAQWISPQFALQVDEWVEELMSTGSVSIKPEPVRQVAPPPVTSLKDFSDIMQIMGWVNDPILKPLLHQRAAEEMGSTIVHPTGPRVVIVAVRATELGVPRSLLGSGSKLGTYISHQGFENLGKIPHGKYPVNTYHLSDALDRAILKFFGMDKGSLYDLVA